MFKTHLIRDNKRFIRGMPVVLIVCLGTAVYSNVFFSSFHFDDGPSIAVNAYIRNIGDLHNIWVFLPCRFLLYLSLAFNYRFNGLDVFGYHLFNLAVHLVSALLVLRLVLLTMSTPVMKGEKIARHADVIALFAGLIFVSHPIQTGAVTYIVQRAASMATMFYLASLCLYAWSRSIAQHTALRNSAYIGSLIMAVFAMFTKETAITLPLMILLYEASFFKDRKGFNWGSVTPFLLTIFIIPVTILLTETHAARLHQLQSEPGISPAYYLITQFRVMVTYIRLAFLPIHQNVDYDYPVYRDMLEPPVLFSFLFLTGILACALRLFLKYRVLAFSICWFFLTLLPESSFLPIKDVIFEHRLYLPLAGYSIFLVCSLYYLLGQKGLKAMVIVLVLIVGFNSILTYQRNKVWKNDLTLWDDALQKSPHKARPYNNRGAFYYSQGKFSLAISDYSRALEINPQYAEALDNRGIVYYKEGQIPQAISDYNRAIVIDPGFADAYYNRGLAYEKQGEVSLAVADYNEVIEIAPRYAAAFYNRGNIYYGQRDYVQAIADYDKAIDLNPHNDNYRNNLALAHKQLNNTLGMTAIRYVALGDSYTIGTGAELNESWPALSVMRLREKGFPVELAGNLGRNGWTTKDLIDHELPELRELRPDLVTLLIGVNDWVQGVDAATFQKHLEYILDELLKLVPDPRHILIITIPDFSVMPSGRQFSDGRDISQGIRGFDQIIVNEARARSLKTVDLYPLSESMGQDPSLIAQDGLHPSAKGYTLWAGLIEPGIEDLLSHKPIGYT